MRSLIINADDFGLSPEINRGVMDCFRAGVVTNASLIVNEAATQDAIQDARIARLPIGLHVNFFSGAFLNEAGLFGPEGKIRRVLLEREMGGIAKTQFTSVERAVIEQEIRNQLGRFDALVGERPNHLSYHFGLHFIQEILLLLIAAAQEYQLPIRYGKQYVGAMTAYEKQVSSWIDVFSGPAFTVQDFFAAIDQAGEGINEISVHPGYPSGSSGDPYDAERENELRILLSDEVRERLAQGDITLVDYSAVR